MPGRPSSLHVDVRPFMSAWRLLVSLPLCLHASQPLIAAAPLSMNCAQCMLHARRRPQQEGRGRSISTDDRQCDGGTVGEMQRPGRCSRRVLRGASCCRYPSPFWPALAGPAPPRMSSPAFECMVTRLLACLSEALLEPNLLVLRTVFIPCTSVAGTRTPATPVGSAARTAPALACNPFRQLCVADVHSPACFPMHVYSLPSFLVWFATGLAELPSALQSPRCDWGCIDALPHP
jgi:hypothetical protein